MVVLTKIASNASIDNENHGSAISTAIDRCSRIARPITMRRDTGCNRAKPKPSWTIITTYVAMPTTDPEWVNRSLSSGKGRNSCSWSG